jgi:hypothetical protein
VSIFLLTGKHASRRVRKEQGGDVAQMEMSYQDKLFKDLAKHFNEEELRTLCYGLEVDYDDLPANPVWR